MTLPAQEKLDDELQRMLAGLWSLGELGDQYALLLRAPEDPYPLYEKLRGQGPVVASRLGVWVTTSHAIGTKLLRDRRFGIRPTSGVHKDQALTTFDNSFLGMDPPDHTRLRRLATPAFSPKMIGQYRLGVEKVVNELIDQVEGGTFDVMDDFAAQVPITVIGDLFGITEEHWDRFARDGRTITQLLDGITSAEQAREVQTAVDGLNELFTELIARRTAEPGDDVISTLVGPQAEGKITSAEIVAMCGMLALAGTETTVNLIGNGIAALLAHPRQWELLREDPDLASAVVEETLRYDTPVQQSDRLAHEDVELGGQLIGTDKQVVVLTAAANRDPDVYSDPGRFDITRSKEAEHLSFSGGRHYCLGAPLARMEAEVAFRTVATRLPKLTRAGATARRKSPVIRGLLRFPVTAN